MMNEKIYTLDELQEIFTSVLSNYSVKKAILFGSYAKNNPTTKSDIDLVIDSDGQLLNINFYGLLEDLVERLEKKVDLFEITEIKKNSDIYNTIVEEGIIVFEK